MVERIIHRLLLRRHFWRYASFGEVAEIYASRTMRIFALRLVTVFTSVYLFQEGFSLTFLALFWAIFYVFKVPFSWPSALIIAKYGPKHGTLISNILAAASMAFLPFVSHSALWSLFGWLVLQASSSCLYDLCYLVDFSKVKNGMHAGKEIAFMNILEQVATGISPVVGGVLAYVASPHVVMAVSSVLFLLSAIPLFRTGEPTHTHQKIDFSGFPWRTTWRSLTAEMAIGYDTFATGTAWTFFMMLIVFTGNGNEIYAKVGALSSVTLIAALFISYTFGKLIDNHKGRTLLRTATILNSSTHFMRVFVTTPIGIIFANLLNQAGTTGYSMAFMRGMFDLADTSGKRIAYLFFIEMAVNLGMAISAVVLGVLLYLSSDVTGLKMFFILATFVTLLIATPRFPLYRK